MIRIELQKKTFWQCILLAVLSAYFLGQATAAFWPDFAPDDVIYIRYLGRDGAFVALILLAAIPLLAIMLKSRTVEPRDKSEGN